MMKQEIRNNVVDRRDYLRNYARMWRAKNREKYNADVRQHRKDNKEHDKLIRKQYRQKNREKLIQQQRKRYGLNRDKILEQRKLWRKNHPELVKETYKQSYQRNRVSRIKQSTQYYQNHKEQHNKATSRYHMKNRTRMNVIHRLQYKLEHVRYLWIIAGRFPSCMRCGQSNIEVLVGDHKNGSGNIDRENHRGQRSAIQYYLKHPDLAREKLQVLCYNCNHLKRVENGEHRGAFR